MSLSQLQQLLPLPEEDLQQVLDYGATLSKPEAVSHFSNLLGDSPLAVDFISSFNSRRKDPTSAPASTPVSAPASGPSSSTESPDAVPKSRRGNQNKKKKAPLHTPQARRLETEAVGGGTAYNKKNDDLDYIPQHQRASAPTSQLASRSGTPTNASKPAAAPPPKQQNEHRSSAGFLISDMPSKSKPKSTPTSRTSTPKPAGNTTTKISIAGGTPMAGQSTALADLDAAIRALEMTTNPTLDGSADPKKRRCNCVATRHPLQTAAPNCLACGKVICMKEGLGPCTYCGAPLLTPAEVQAMVKELKGERGRELMAADAKANRRAEVSKKPAPFSQNKPFAPNNDPSLADAQAQATAHRDKLLNFQAQNAKRTTVRDEAADFDVGGAMSGTGGSMWASPEERAKELKRQQKLMREMEWNAKPEYEKRQQVISIDLVGGKVIRRMAAVERPVTPESDEDLPPSAPREALTETAGNKGKGGGAFSGNPLLGSLIKPVFDAKGKGPELEGRKSKKASWRRVQNDLDDNEGVILDGGVYGHGTTGDEPDCG